MQTVVLPMETEPSILVLMVNTIQHLPMLLILLTVVLQTKP